MNEEMWNDGKKRLSEALKILGPLGFEDADDEENPMMVYHQGLSQSFDVSAIDPKAIILVVGKVMHDVGYKQAQRDIRESLGLS